MNRLSIAMLVIASPLFATDPQDITFKSKLDATEQRYIELLPDSFDPLMANDVLIALHGHGSDRWQFIKDTRGECKGLRDTAERYGMIYVSPDYRAKTSWMGPAAEADVVQIIGELKQRHHVNRIFIAGGSMGGTAALTFTALHPDLIAGVCCLNGTANLVEYDKFQDARTASFGGLKSEKPDEYKKRSAEFWPEKFTMPVAFTTGGKDESVPPQSVLRLAEKLKQDKRKLLSIHRAAGGHSTTYEDTVSAMEFVLREAGALTFDQKAAWLQQLSTSPVLKRSEMERERLIADIRIFSAAVGHALAFDTAFSQADIRLIEKAVVRDRERAITETGPWTTKRGKVVRGFVSAVDGSVLPYGVIIPKSYDGTKPMRLDVVLHGSSKPIGMSELKFINRFDEGDEDKGNAPDVDYIELHPLGRVENCYR
ncbi:MAG: prolyl oligopeptidase family serine peptidase, partial [Verrucomicrobiales bacterium]|nr:prolyl oligopeptidase family serine peptidase [Verrucomicrobiales bacterium]